jgi:putative PIN family toxin of toxin-antitoxin system
VLRVTADTNILVSGLIFLGGKPFQFLDLARAGKIDLVVSDAILAEMEDVLPRKFHFSPGDVVEARRRVAAMSRAVYTAVTVDVIKEDPPDNRILECAVGAGSEYLVTGDKDLLRLKSYSGIRIMTVSDFLDLARAQVREHQLELRMSRKREHERVLFAAFLDIEPEFAGEGLADWHQPPDESDFPDIKGTSVSGRCIGVEIGEWLNEDEIAAAKRKEKTEASFLEAIGDQGANPTQHIRYVWLHPKGRIAVADARGFREQLFGFILDCDARWPGERYWGGGAIFSSEELAAYPMLARYLSGIKLHPAREEGKWERNWITFPVGGGAFDKETMLGPLRNLVREKTEHYGKNTGFDDLTLLVVYNQALFYNSPAETPLHSYEDAVEEIRKLFADNRGPFDRVLLYVSVLPGRVLKVC